MLGLRYTMSRRKNVYLTTPSATIRSSLAHAWVGKKACTEEWLCQIAVLFETDEEHHSTYAAGMKRGVTEFNILRTSDCSNLLT